MQKVVGERPAGLASRTTVHRRSREDPYRTACGQDTAADRFVVNREPQEFGADAWTCGACKTAAKQAAADGGRLVNGTGVAAPPVRVNTAALPVGPDTLEIDRYTAAAVGIGTVGTLAAMLIA
jgi:hypothetical protein